MCLWMTAGVCTVQGAVQRGSTLLAPAQEGRALTWRLLLEAAGTAQAVPTGSTTQRTRGWDRPCRYLWMHPGMHENLNSFYFTVERCRL